MDFLKATARVVLISLISVLGMLSLLILMRFAVMQNRNNVELNPHANQERPIPLVFARGDESLEFGFSEESFISLNSLGNNVIPTFDVRPTQDLKWVVLGEQDLNSYTLDGKGSVEIFQWDKINKLNLKPSLKSDREFRKVTKNLSPQSGKVFLLADYLKKYPLKQLGIILHSKEVASVAHFLSTLPLDEKASVYIIAPNHHVWRELRRRKPEWSFVSTSTLFAQWKVYASLFLLPFAPQEFDWMLISNHSPIDSRISEELRWRKIPLLLQGEPPFAWEETTPPQGVLTHHPRAALKFFESWSEKSK